MLLNNTRSFFLVITLVLLSSYDVLGMPVRNTEGRVQDPTSQSLTRRTDAELMAELLKRGGSSRSSSISAGSGGTSSSTRSLGPHVVTVCHPQTAKRSLEELLLTRADSGSESGHSSGKGSVSSEEQDITMKVFDPEGKMLLKDKKELADVGEPLKLSTGAVADGSQAAILHDKNHPDLLIKHFKYGEKNPFTPGNIYKEKKYLERVGHYGGKLWYTLRPPSARFPNAPPQFEEVWMWLKLVPGKGLDELGLHSLPHDEHHQETSAFAKGHAVGTQERKTFIDDLIIKVTAKALEYAKEMHVRHLDVSAANVRIVLDAAQKHIEKVDLIDWGQASTTGCSPETEARLRQHVRDAFINYLPENQRK